MTYNERENATQMRIHHLCYILFAKNKSLNPTHTPGVEITQSCEYQEARRIEAILEVAYHTMQKAWKERSRQKKEKMQ